jgi:hypothetical protein
MGQVLHGSARTTAALRRTIQHGQESIARLAVRYDSTPRRWLNEAHAGGDVEGQVFGVRLHGRPGEGDGDYHLRLTVWKSALPRSKRSAVRPPFVLKLTRLI